MDPVSNPYAPGAGLRPPELAGRTDEIERFEVLLARLEAGRVDRGIVLTGLRGVGKTVLLNELWAKAEAHDWVVGKIEAGDGKKLGALAAEAFAPALRSAAGRSESGVLRRALAVFRSFALTLAPDGSLSFGVEVEPAMGTGDSGDLEMDLSALFVELGRAGAELNIGAALIIDEVQDLTRPELAALSGACHAAGQRSVPVVLVAAGLPSVPGLMAEAKSYEERLYEYRTIDSLDAPDAHRALALPAEAAGVEWSEEALDMVIEAAAGYPYFLQVFGKATWDFASRNPIGSDDARIGIAAGGRELDTGFFGARWDRATKAQRQYLRAMAELGDEAVGTADVARHLGRRASDLSPHRDQLIRKGLIYAPEWGSVAFTVPGMGEFVRRQADR